MLYFGKSVRDDTTHVTGCSEDCNEVMSVKTLGALPSGAAGLRLAVR